MILSMSAGNLRDMNELKPMKRCQLWTLQTDLRN